MKIKHTMTTQTKRHQMIEFIRERCVEANESIRDLVFGCRGIYENEEVLLTRYGMDFDNVDGPNVYVWQGGNGGRVFRSHNEGIEIIGREIRLADIMNLQGKIELSKDFNGLLGFVDDEFWSISTSKPSYGLGVYWNLLKDNLNDQSDETILFVFNLLSK